MLVVIMRITNITIVHHDKFIMYYITKSKKWLSLLPNEELPFHYDPMLLITTDFTVFKRVEGLTRQADAIKVVNDGTIGAIFRDRKRRVWISDFGKQVWSLFVQVSKKNAIKQTYSNFFSSWDSKTIFKLIQGTGFGYRTNSYQKCKFVLARQEGLKAV